MRHPAFFLLRGRKGGRRDQCFFSLHELFPGFYVLLAVRPLRVFDLFLQGQSFSQNPVAFLLVDAPDCRNNVWRSLFFLLVSLRPEEFVPHA